MKIHRECRGRGKCSKYYADQADKFERSSKSAASAGNAAAAKADAESAAVYRQAAAAARTEGC